MENASIIANVDENMVSEQRTYQSKIYEYLTIVVHIFIVAYCVFTLYLCLSYELFFFTWHPVLLSLGWVLLMGEGILIFAPGNRLTTALSHKTKVKLHWIIQSISLGSGVIGFIVIYINKDLHNKPHFHSWHGILGLISTVLFIPVGMSGIIALYSFNFRDYIHPITTKLIHRICGVATFVAGGVTILLSLYTNWFKRRVNDDITLMWFILLFFTIFWCVRSPTLKINLDYPKYWVIRTRYKKRSDENVDEDYDEMKLGTNLHMKHENAIKSLVFSVQQRTTFHCIKYLSQIRKEAITDFKETEKNH
ncbi:hypothetical protein FQA39_LY02304 [Lamprigera yunnana]|nr:hypothetical protein FQA39_LY02304 [Lamprigera yunnana]